MDMAIITFTPRGVYKLKPGRYWDRQVGGLVLAVKLPGKGSWLIRGSMYPPGDRRRDVTYRIGSLGAMDLDIARKTAAPLLEQLKKGTHPKYVSPSGAVTLQQAYATWATGRRRKGGSAVHVKNVLNDASNHVGDLLHIPMIKINPAMVADRYADIVARLGPAAGRNFRVTFTSAWNAQRRRTPELPECPNRAIDRVPMRSERDEVAGKVIEDLPAWWAATYTAVDQLKGAALRFQLLSGLRSHNVFAMERRWLDIPGQVCRFPSGAMKSRRRFDLPLSQPMIAILAEAAAI
jgi:hypothetical protein